MKMDLGMSTRVPYSVPEPPAQERHVRASMGEGLKDNVKRGQGRWA